MLHDTPVSARDLCFIASFSKNTVPSGAEPSMNFGDKDAPDIVLLDRAERSRNQTPQPSHVARRVNIACDNSRPKRQK